MKKIVYSCLFTLLFAVIFFTKKNYAQDAPQNTTLLGHLAYDTMQLANVWGYTANGKEYALVGTQWGLSVVDVTDPATPTQLAHVTATKGTWREVKTWGNYAYVTSETNPLTIVNLKNLPNSVEAWQWTGGVLNETDTISIYKTHSIFIDENGIGYLNGANSGYYGMVLIDIAQNPENPKVIATYNNYVHDCYARHDTIYTAEVYDGWFRVIDATDKSNLTIVNEVKTPKVFTHNTWLSDNGKYLYTTDEKEGAWVTSYDISDINDIKELDRYKSNPSKGSIPHNTHVLGNYVVTAHYKDGFTVADITYPDNIIQVASYDTSPFPSEGGYKGCWGVYPYLPSGNILASDMQKGLFIVGFEHKQACYLQGTVTASGTQKPIPNATVFVDSSNFAVTHFDGSYATGTANEGTYQVIASAYGYIADTFEVQLINAQITTLNIQLDTLIPPKATAAFAVQSQTGCAPFTLTFNNISENAPNGYVWKFLGSNTFMTNAQSPTVTYNNVGTYDVMLIAKSQYGNDTLILENYITVFPAFNAQVNATISPAATCANTPIQLNATLADPNSEVTNWEWTGDNLENANELNATATPNQAGENSYIITLYNQNNCFVTDTVSVQVFELPNFDLKFATEYQCFNDTTTLKLVNNGEPTVFTNYVWSNNLYSVQPAQAIINDTTQIYSLTVTDLNGCTGSASVKAYVPPPPVANIGVTPFCYSNPYIDIYFEPHNAIMHYFEVTKNDTLVKSYTYESGSPGSVVFSPISTGTYTVQMTAIGYCGETATTTQNFEVPPAIDQLIATYTCNQCTIQNDTLMIFDEAAPLSALITLQDAFANIYTINLVTVTEGNLQVGIPTQNFEIPITFLGDTHNQLSVTFTDTNGCQYTQLLNFSYGVFSGVPTNNNNPNTAFELNPTLLNTTDFVLKNNQFNNNTPTTVHIFNAIGQKIMQQNLYNHTTQIQLPKNTCNGLYYIQLQQQNQILGTQKIILQR